MGAAAQVPAWVPPTDVERALFEAKTRQDWDAYLQVLFAAQTFAYAPKQLVDDDQLIAWVPHTAAHGPRFLAVYTRGELSAPRAGEVACDIALPLAPYVWWGEKLRGMVVNPGTPTEAYFPGARRKRRRWLALRDQLPQHDPDRDAGALLTKYTGPLRGPLAVGLACGAHLSVHRRALWNDLTDVYADYRADTKILREAWGAASAAQWRRQLDFLLAGQNSPPQPEFVLRVRRAIARHTAGAGASVDSTLWQRTAVETLRERGTAEAELTEVRALIRRIIRYEARFRADGLLPADGYVGSAAGYDFGRAVSVARWGLGARYADGAEAEAAVITAGVLCRRHYTSWADFSAGYVLGRVLRFDDESFGPMYASALAPHRLLLDTPTSPWRTLPFTAPAV